MNRLTTSLTQEALVQGLATRNYVLQIIENKGKDSLRNNKELWNLGTKFNTVCGGMMLQQVADFFEVSKDAIRDYYADTNEHKSELIVSGLVNLNNAQLKELKKNFIAADSCNENDITSSIKFHSRGGWFFPLEAVIKLGMFMTGTPKAVEFRNKLINEVKMKGIIQNELVKTTDLLMDSLITNVKSGVDIDKNEIFKAIKQCISNGMLVSRSQLRKTILQLTTLSEEFKIRLKLKKDSLIELTSVTGYDEFSALELEDEIERLGSMQSLVAVDLLPKYNNLEREMGDKLMASLDGRTERNITDILCRIYPELGGITNRIVKNKAIKIKKDLLVQAGIWIIDWYSSSSGRITNNYVPSTKYAWMESSKVGSFTRNGTSQSIKFSEYGEYLMEYIYTIIIPSIKNITELDGTLFTQEEFEDYLIELLLNKKRGSE